MWLMGLDVGTTGVKAAIFDECGKMKGYGFQEASIFQGADGNAEQDAEVMFKILLDVMRQATQSGAGKRVGAVALSVQGDAVIPVDENGKPLTRAMLGMDYRCAPQTRKFELEFGGEWLFRTTGIRPHPMNSLCKIRYFTEQRPELAEKVRWYMTYADYLLYRLGSAEPVIDYTMASRTMAMELSTGSWNTRLLNAAGISEEQLSRPVLSGVIVGKLKREWADETGVPPGTLLVSGGHDQVCAAVGAGLGQSGLALDSHGTAEVISAVLKEPLLNEIMYRAGYPCYAYARKGHYFTFSLNHTGGLLLKWFVQNFGSDKGKIEYSTVLANVKDEPSELLLLPYLNGRGTPVPNVNIKGMVAGLSLTTTRADMVRAILEALAFDMRVNIETMRLAGISIEKLRCVGGGARSEMGVQLKADICNCPVATLCVREAACLGAALLAGIAAGQLDHLGQSVNFIREERIFQPRPAMVERYKDRYALYKTLAVYNESLYR